jgi:hypothetical protein
VVISAIDGMGGIGKSALAVKATHELVDADVFPGGQLYMNLQGATPGLAPLELLGRMLRALGVEPTQVPTETEEAVSRPQQRARPAARTATPPTRSCPSALTRLSAVLTRLDLNFEVKRAQSGADGQVGGPTSPPLTPCPASRHWVQVESN